MSPSARVTMLEIATAAGVHPTTVSRALAGCPRISPATTRRVQQIAAELGYKPDPGLAALNAYRINSRSPRYRANIAWVTNHLTREGWNSCGIYDGYFRGARARASGLGYNLEEFWLREPGLTRRRAGDILKARGITGIIVSPQQRTKTRVILDWQHFSAVALGYSTAWPRLHVVTNDHFQSVTSVLRRVHALGYRRPGLVQPRKADDRVDQGWSAAFLAAQQRWPGECRIPILDAEKPGKFLFEWLEVHRPDVIVSGAYDVLDLLESSGYRIPEDFGFAAYSAYPGSREIACIDENAFQTGATAVEEVVGMLHRKEQGTPTVPRTILIESSWKDGGTLRPQGQNITRSTSKRETSKSKLPLADSNY